jgi:RNA polymerase sigma-70 factor (ECF subfamily)
MPELDDLALVQQCLQGSNRAFETLVDKYQKPLFNTAYRMVNNADDAEEITQAAFVKAFEKLETFKPKYKFFSWLYRIAINETINFTNKKKNNDALDEEFVHNGKMPDEDCQQTQISESIQNALLEIKPEYRSVIILRHLQEFSYLEISEILDIPEKIVKSRLFTARQLLRDILLEKGIYPGG